MKVLFLDFDGVIAHHGSVFCIDSKKISIIKRIVNKTGCKIVVTSSWKSDFTNVDEFKKYHLNLCKKKKTNYHWLFSNIYDITENNLLNRACEIKNYLNSHDIESYVILDDECDFGSHKDLLKFTVQTNIKCGIKPSQINEILNKFNQYNNVR